MRLASTTCLALALGLTLAACDAASADADAGPARITVRMTDAPFPFDLVDSVNVTVTRIELRAAEADTTDADSAAADDDRDGDRLVLFEAGVDGDPYAFNLLDLRDGVSATLVDGSDLPSDRVYRQIRVYVGDDSRVVFKDGRTYDLKTPSAQRSGIKINLPTYAVDGGDEIDLLLDYNVEDSFVTRGNPASANFKGFLFKPVIRVQDFDVEAREPGESDDEGSDDEESDDEGSDDDGESDGDD